MRLKKNCVLKKNYKTEKVPVSLAAMHESKLIDSKNDSKSIALSSETSMRHRVLLALLEAML